MKRLLFLIFGILFTIAINVYAANNDSLTIHNLGHASVMLEFNGKVIHIDPRDKEADYASLPDADIICITHEHGDHYDLNAISKIKKESTVMVLTQTVKDLNSSDGENVVMVNGDSINLKGITIEAVPSYNLNDGNGTPRHIKGVGNGYIFTFNDLRVLLAGDTHNIPEMANFNVDIAFIPMNQPYTMTPEMAAEAAKILNPRILYVYHYDTKFVNTLNGLLQSEAMEIRIGESEFIEATVENITSSLLPDININKFLIYPNPSNGFINIEQQNDCSDLFVYDLSGRLLFKEDNLKAGCNNVDLQTLKSGNYFLIVNSPKAYSLRKLITIIK